MMEVAVLQPSLVEDRSCYTGDVVDYASKSIWHMKRRG